MPRPDRAICSSSRANFQGSAVLHFIFVELRCLFLYWCSFRNALVKLETTLYLVDERVRRDDVGSRWLDTVGCIGDEVSMAANSFDSSFTGSCVTYVGDNYLSWFLHSCSLICGLILLWSIHRFIVEGNSFNQVFGSGNYLVFTWKLSHDRIYRTLATILPFYTGALMGAILAVILGLIGNSDGSLGLRRTLSLLGAELALQVLSLVALLRPTLPGFHWQTQEFRRLQFSRTWLNLMWESNDTLAHTLSDAICIRTPDFIHVQDYALLWELHVKYDEIPPDEAEGFRSLAVSENNEAENGDSPKKSSVPCGGWCLAAVAVAAIASLVALILVASGSAVPMHHQDDIANALLPAPAPVPCFNGDIPLQADCPPDRGVDYCMSHFESWQTHWDDERQSYCCDRCGRGCPSEAQPPSPPIVPEAPPPAPPIVVEAPPPAPPSVPEEFDCNAGFRNWYFGWSDNKKQWCCEQFGKACPGTWTGPDHPDAEGWR